MRLAFFTPLHPERPGAWADSFSGITDHNEELLWTLGDHAEIDVVIGPYMPARGTTLERFRVIRADEFLRNRARYTAAIYHIANNFAQHRYMVPCMRQAPGIVVLHDCCLHHLVLGLTLRQGRLRAFENALKRTHGDDARSAARTVLFGLADPGSMMLAGPVVEPSTAVVVYNEYARQRLVRVWPDALVRVIPLGVPADETAPTDGLRARHGFGTDDFILASINSVSHTKRLTTLLSAVARLAARFPQVRLLIAGGGSLGAGTRRAIQRFNLAGVVRVAGWVPRETYRDYVHLCDAVVDLRDHCGAETAGSLARALAAGKPALVSAQGSFLELPEDCCVKIPRGSTEGRSLELAIARLIEDPSSKQAMGNAARRYARTRLRLDCAARDFIELARECARASSAAHPRGDVFGPEGTPLSRFAVSSVFRMSRAWYLFRHYGLADTARRMREELGWSTSGARP